MPGQLTSFVGREADLALVGSRLGKDRLVSLVGPGGCGKTRLAVEVGRQAAKLRPGDVYFVDLSGLTDPGLVPSAVSSALGLREAPGLDPVEVLVSQLGGAEMLVLIDNCEHVVAACAALANALVRGCPGVRILATSREPLGVTGEVVIAIAGLELPGAARTGGEGWLVGSEAGRLYVDRARRACPRLVLDEAATLAVAEICRRLDGIPLALELAAARARFMSADAIAEGLSDRFRLLVGSGRAAPERQKTLLASIEWSTGLLVADERALLYRLAAFASGFTLAAAEAVCAGDGIERGDVLALLSALVDKSLVHADPAIGRFRLHETMRAFAADALDGAGATAKLRDRHLGYFTQMAGDMAPKYWTTEVAASLRTLDADLDNLRSALDWAVVSGQFDAGAELMGAVGNFFFMRSLRSEASRRCQDLLAADLAPLKRADVLYWAAQCLANLDPPRALCLAEELTALGRLLGNETTVARGLVSEAGVHGLGQPDRAIAAADEAIPIARRVGRTDLVVSALVSKCNAYTFLIRPREALTAGEEAVRAAEEAGWPWGAMRARAQAAFAAMWAGQLREALEEAKTVLRFADELSYPLLTVLAENARAEATYFLGDPGAAEAAERARSVGMASGDIFNAEAAEAIKGQVLIWVGQEKEGYELLEQGTAKLERFGFRRSNARNRALLAEVALRRGDIPTARRHLAAYLNHAPRKDDPWSAPGLRAKARLARTEADGPRAHALACEGLALAYDVGALLYAVDLLELVAVTCADLGRHAEAARLLGASECQREAIGYVRPVPGCDELVPVLADIQAALGREAMEQAISEGRALRFEDAVAHSLRGRAEHSRAVSGLASLTPAERRVAELVAQHLTNAEIAQQLFVSTATTKSHLTRVFRKLGVQGRRQLATFVASTTGLSDDP